MHRHFVKHVVMHDLDHVLFLKLKLPQFRILMQSVIEGMIHLLHN